MASDSLYKALNMLSGITLNITRAAEQKSKLLSLERRENAAREWKEKYQKQRDDFTLQRATSHEVFNQNENEITRLGNEMAKYNLSISDYFKADDYKEKTKEGTEILEDLGYEIGENMQVRFKIGETAQDIIQKTTNAIPIQQRIIDDLSTKLNSIQGLKQYVADVGIDLGIAATRDIDDYQLFVDENRAMIDNPLTELDESGFSRLDDPATDEDESREAIFASEGQPDYLEKAFLNMAPSQKDALSLATKQMAYEKELGTYGGSEGLNDTFRLRSTDNARIESLMPLTGTSPNAQEVLDNREFMAAVGGPLSDIKGDVDLMTNKVAAMDVKDMNVNAVLSLLSNDRIATLNDPHLQDLVTQAKDSRSIKVRTAIVMQIANYLLPQKGEVGNPMHGFVDSERTLTKEDGTTQTIPGYNIGWHAGEGWNEWYSGDEEPQAIARDRYLFNMLGTITDIMSTYTGEAEDAWTALETLKVYEKKKKDEEVNKTLNELKIQGSFSEHMQGSY